MPTRVYLDLDIDDHRAKHARARAFVEHTNLRYAFSSKSLDALGGSERARVPELYESDHEWHARGAIALDAAEEERIVIELDDGACPLASENFMALCAGDRGISKESGAALTYKGSVIHRCVKGFMLQGGDFTHGNGAGGECVFAGKKTFKDDVKGLKKKHDAMGVVSMGNTGKNSNSSQFFITFAPCPKLDGKHVVFGRVVEGLSLIAKINDEIAVAPGGLDEKPTKSIVIADCGVLSK